MLLRMSDALMHRGPDAAGIYIDEPVSLAHRRLSIIDIEGGDQPMSSDDGKLVLVFNGEIYNYRELRDQLAAEGHRFRTRSDTEVILHAYQKYGTGCLDHLDGMFSFVLFDATRKQLFGARDRFGKKPLYYCASQRETGNHEVTFAFASELKSLREHPAIAASLRLSEAGLASYLLNDYLLGEQRIFAGIQLLPAGTAFSFGLPGSSAPGFQQWKYWDISFDQSHTPGEIAAASEPELAAKVLELLRSAVGKRLVADVPVGALLSGGVDSSAIVALMTEFKPAGEIETFSIGFDERSFDESEHAARVARHYGTRHFTRRFTVDEMLEGLPLAIRQMDEPFADPSIMPVSMLCEFARQRVTVALGGDGGDELFAGYDPFRAVWPAERYRRFVPDWLHRQLVMRLADQLPSSSRNMAIDFKARRFLRGVSAPRSLRVATWMGAFSAAQLERLMPDSRFHIEAAVAPVLESYERIEEMGGDALAHALDFFERHYLTDDILVKVDRASMMHSLEVRTPFLDTALAEFVHALPSRLKLRGGATKYLLKQALLRSRGDGPTVPKDIVHRKKKGFGIPVAKWIRTELREAFQRTLVDDWPKEMLPMFDQSVIADLLRQHVERTRNNYKELWALYVLARWARVHLLREAIPNYSASTSV